ncbi:hypothetical protein AA109_15550, partial [Listeria monocytogenes]
PSKDAIRLTKLADADYLAYQFGQSPLTHFYRQILGPSKDAIRLTKLADADYLAYQFGQSPLTHFYRQ